MPAQDTVTTKETVFFRDVEKRVIKHDERTTVWLDQL